MGVGVEVGTGVVSEDTCGADAGVGAVVGVGVGVEVGVAVGVGVISLFVKLTSEVFPLSSVPLLPWDSTL